MKSLGEMSFKELEMLLCSIAEKFFYAQKMISDSKNIEEITQYKTFLNKVQMTYDTLDDLERNLINNEFFFQGYGMWWKSLYSKATFYRYKKETMMKFLGAFYGV